MSDIELIDDAPFVRLTLNRSEAAIVHALLADSTRDSLVQLRDGDFDYFDLALLSDEELSDLSFDIYEDLEFALNDRGCGGCDADFDEDATLPLVSTSPFDDIYDGLFIHDNDFVGFDTALEDY